MTELKYGFPPYLLQNWAVDFIAPYSICVNTILLIHLTSFNSSTFSMAAGTVLERTGKQKSTEYNQEKEYD